MRDFLSLRFTKWMFFVLMCLCIGQNILATPALTSAVKPTLTTIPFHGTRAFTVSVNNTARPAMIAAIQAAPVVYWFSPGKVPLGNTTFTVNGANFVSGAVAYLDGVAMPTTFISSTQLKVASNFSQSGSGNLTVTNPGGMTSSPRLLEYGQGIVVTISPISATVATNATQQFTATVTGTANTKVYWYVVGGSVNGTITSTGLYKAPAGAPASQVTIRAVCDVNSERQATATVTVTGAPQTVAVNISPASASVQTAATQQFTATVTGSANTAVTWQVNGVTGGNSTVGTISNAGLYTAPAAVPAGNVVVTAISQADNTKSASATVTVTTPPVPVVISISPTSASLAVNATQQFTATVTGSPNTAVTWQVNNVDGGNATFGTISSNGLYTAPSAIPAGTITVTAVSVANTAKKANATVTILDTQAIAVGRFLEQATFGPTPQLTAYVKQVGIQQYLNEQFAAPESIFPNGNAMSTGELRDRLYFNFATGQDQLRQRTVHALSEIVVISSNKNYYANMLHPWLQILSKNAFGNYKTLLKEITLDASMGNFLDMVNSTKPGVNGGANENYARELMQLFSIGLYKLNQDGSLQLDANNKPIPTYNQTDVRQLALALTGWTFNTANGTPQYPNPNYYPGPMVPLPNYHDTSSKTFLGQTIPANQTMQKDIDDVIDIVFNHPNVAPFICTRLIRAFVTSNPSPAYIARVSAVFNDNGLNVRGDLKAVITAILLDPEARNDTPPNDFGKLRTPMMHHIALFRLLGATIPQPTQFVYVYDNMGESVLNAPSVFGHYSPMYRIPKQNPPLFGPEFQIHGPGELVNRGNFLWSYMSYYQTGIWDLQWLFSLGNNDVACINAVDNLLLYGRMSPGLRQSLMTALQSSTAAGADAKMKALTVLYLTAMSSEYLVMH